MYPVTAIPRGLRWTVAINPAGLPVLLGREAFFGRAGITAPIVVGGLVASALVLLSGRFSNRVGARISDDQRPVDVDEDDLESDDEPL
jgi:ABC-type polysaccharide/polyol phosphate export permease